MLRFETADDENVLDTESAIAHVLSLSGFASQPEALREALRGASVPE